LSFGFRFKKRHCRIDPQRRFVLYYTHSTPKPPHQACLFPSIRRQQNPYVPKGTLRISLPIGFDKSEGLVKTSLAEKILRLIVSVLGLNEYKNG